MQSKFAKHAQGLVPAKGIQSHFICNIYYIIKYFKEFVFYSYFATYEKFCAYENNYELFICSSDLLSIILKEPLIHDIYRRHQCTDLH